MAPRGHDSGLRKRNAGKDKSKDRGDAPQVEGDGPGRDKIADDGEGGASLVGSYWLARIAFLRGLALIYLVAFAVAFNQNKELIGDRGLLPVKLYLARVKQASGGDLMSTPTLLWLLEPWESVDWALDALALSGAALSALVLATGAANLPAMLSLWALYHSLVNVGQSWYSFGWESQLLETGFLAVWIVPLWRWRPLPRGTPTPWVAVVGYRYCIRKQRVTCFPMINYEMVSARIKYAYVMVFLDG